MIEVQCLREIRHNSLWNINAVWLSLSTICLYLCGSCSFAGAIWPILTRFCFWEQIFLYPVWSWTDSFWLTLFPIFQSPETTKVRFLGQVLLGFLSCLQNCSQQKLLAFLLPSSTLNLCFNVLASFISPFDSCSLLFKALYPYKWLRSFTFSAILCLWLAFDTDCSLVFKLCSL